MFSLIGVELWNTLYMTFVSTAIAYIIGLPLGVVLVVTSKEGIHPNRLINASLGVIVNVLRSVPFLILLVAIQGLTRFIMGTTIGPSAMIVPLVVAAAPFIARIVESSIKEVDAGVIEAAQSMGASNWNIVTKVMLSEAKPSILVGAAVAIITILGYSAMAGFVGGGGLGDIAIRYGWYRYEADTMWIVVAVLVILVQIMQEVGMKISKVLDNRI